MHDPSLPAQDALVVLLRATPSPAGAKVYDKPPTGALPPYATIGEGDAAPTDEDGLDATEINLQIDAWSDYSGWAEVKAIASAYRAVLDERPLVAVGHRIERMHVRSISYMRDPNGITRRARILLTLYTQPA